MMLKFLLVSATSIGLLVANAGNQWTWYIGDNTSIRDGSGSNTRASGTAYLFDSAVKTPQNLLNEFLQSKTLADYIDGSSSTLIEGKPEAAFEYGSGEGYSFSAYFAMIMGSQIYISNVIESPTSGTGQRGVEFYNQTTPSKKIPTESGIYNGAGWYTAPEPMTWAMVLVGVGLIAIFSRHRMLNV